MSVTSSLPGIRHLIGWEPVFRRHHVVQCGLDIGLPRFRDLILALLREGFHVLVAVTVFDAVSLPEGCFAVSVKRHLFDPASLEPDREFHSLHTNYISIDFSHRYETWSPRRYRESSVI
jgi:hypothetical protein